MIKRYTIIVFAIIMAKVTILIAPPPTSQTTTFEDLQEKIASIIEQSEHVQYHINEYSHSPTDILIKTFEYMLQNKYHNTCTEQDFVKNVKNYLKSKYPEKLTIKKIKEIINQSNELLNLKKYVPIEQIIKTIKNYKAHNPNAKRKEIIEYTKKTFLSQKIARLKEKEVNTKKLIQKYKEKIRKLQEERAIFHQKRKYAKKEYLKLKIKELNLKPLVIPTKKFFTTDGTVSYRKNILEDEEEIPFTPNSANSTISNLSAISTPKTPSIPIPHSNYSYHQHQKAAHPSSLSSRSSSGTPRSTSPSLTNQSLNLNLKDIDPFAGYVLKQK